MTIRLCISDLDGTLIDTHGLNAFCYQQAMARHGYDIDYDKVLEAVRKGRKARQFIPDLTGMSAEESEIIRTDKKALYLENLDKAVLIPSTHSLLRQLHEVMPLALCSSASKMNGQAMLDHFGLTPLFQRVMFEEDTRALGLAEKPSPAGYQAIMQHFGVAPNATLILEDSPVGLQAALASKAHVLQVHIPT